MNALSILIGLSLALGQLPTESTKTSTVEVASKPVSVPLPPKQTGVVTAPVQATPPPLPAADSVKPARQKPTRRLRERKRTPKPKPEPAAERSGFSRTLLLEIPDSLALPSNNDLVSSERETELHRFAWFLFCGLLLFLVNRLLSRAIRKTARDEKRWALIVVRAWPLLELVIWIALALWSVASFWGTQNNFVLYTLIGVVVLVLATQWNVLRDIAAGFCCGEFL